MSKPYEDKQSREDWEESLRETKLAAPYIAAMIKVYYEAFLSEGFNEAQATLLAEEVFSAQLSRKDDA